MCELQWYALAEIHLKKQEKPWDIYCLCSRVFIRNKDDNLKRNPSSAEFSASEEELLIDDELSSECNSLPTISKSKIKQEVEHETVSCYCSASHTDNLSTDEHDSLRDTHDAKAPLRGLQSSDSGADLTEYVKHDIDSDWHKFWSLNGEKLIWESWIGRYSAYINPDYLNQAQDQSDPSFCQKDRDLLTLDLDVNKVDSLKTIDENSRLPSERPQKPTGGAEVEVKNRTLIRNLSGSDDRLFNEPSEGWNPLSPVSVDCETEVERLLSSRCGSHASSSLRTVDSMTNVTRISVSSLDLSQISSPNNSESFSSVSSVQSSLSSTSSEDIEEDYHHQWNSLWKKHYEAEYLRHYQVFVSSWKEHNITDANVCAKLDASDFNADDFLNDSTDSRQRSTKENFHKVFQGRVDDDDVKSPIDVSSEVADSLGHMMGDLKMADNKMAADDERRSKSNASEDDGDARSECGCATNADEVAEMAAMGLPTAFGNKRPKTEEERSKGVSFSLPALNDSDGDLDASRKRIKAAFNLLGIEFKDTNSSPISGRVQYKMKHIRLQNRHLKLRNEPIRKPRHIRFDGDGNMTVPEITEENKFQASVLPDSSDDKQSSEDEEMSESVTTPSKAPTEEQNEEILLPNNKRKKRKKKLAVPPEIRENSHLRKYWHRRFNLFSRFDEGIKLDEESWYSVTPEHLAKHIAERCKCNVIIDGFCGAGGNAIQFASTCQRVIAIDIDPKKIELAKNNAEVYGVADKIEFVVGDFFELAPGLKADVVFFSPPWGGPSYLKEIVYDLDSMLLPRPISQLLEAGRQITSNIAVFLPKNSNSFLLIDSSKPGGGVEIEQNFMKKNLVSITAYYNDLIKKNKV